MTQILLTSLHKRAPQYKLVYLTYAPFKSVKSSIKDLTIQPYAIGMYNPTISKKEIKKAHELGIAVFAWTVNSYKDFERLKRYEIDGIITDYPGEFYQKII